MGQYLDTFLQKSVTKTRSYLRDTKNFLTCLQTVNLVGKPHVILVTADVASLDSVIQHDDVLLGLNWALKEMIFHIMEKYSLDMVWLIFFPIAIFGTATDFIRNKEEFLWAQNLR